ncbi:MAG: RCC1 domain-containing protein [Acidimicrobiia bacterium]|nr:RCC1 domain-containing protein [Acidimicrobiia bacterium]
MPGTFDPDIGDSEYSFVPVPVEGITGATAVAVASRDGDSDYSGDDFAACALIEDETVTCWGYENLGGSAADATGDTEPLSSVEGITSATSISAGNRYFCAVVEDGSVWCWG